MILRSWSVTGFVALLLLFTSAVSAGEWGQEAQGLEKSGPIDSKSKVMASDFCTNYNTSGFVTGPGDLGGSDGTMEVGDTFTFTATGDGSGSWRIVGDPGGVVTYTSGGTFPGTLTYVVPAGGQVAAGMGFYVDSYTGPGDTISGSCGSTASAPVPSLSFWNRILVVVLIGSIGFAAFRRKRVR